MENPLNFFSILAAGCVHAALELENISSTEKMVIVAFFFYPRLLSLQLLDSQTGNPFSAAFPVVGEIKVCAADELLQSSFLSFFSGADLWLLAWHHRSETAHHSTQKETAPVAQNASGFTIQLHQQDRRQHDLKICNCSENMRSFCILLNTSYYPWGDFYVFLKQWWEKMKKLQTQLLKCFLFLLKCFASSSEYKMSTQTL